MYKFVLTSAALVSVASALTPISLGDFVLNFAGNHTRPQKAGKQSGCGLRKSAAGKQGGNACGIEVNGFHYLCDSFSYADAAAACTDNGWRLAVVNDDNKLDVQSVIAQCATDYYMPAWIASFNGLEGEECAIALPFGAAVNGFPSEVCGSSFPVVCQDIPVEVVTEPVPIDTTTVEAILTTTVAVLPTCPGQRLKPCPRKNENSDFVLIDSLLPYVQAECACNQLGLKLADLNITNFLDASNELWQTLGARKHAWIHSWNGDVYEEDDCLALWTGSTGPNGAIAVPQSCEQRKPVLCQRKPRHHHCPCQPQQHDCHCHGHHHHHHHHHQVLLQKPEFEIEQVKNADEGCKGKDCPKVCHYRVGNIRVVKKAVGAYEAEEVCRQFGWNLLDMSQENQYQVAALQNKCGDEKDGYNMWIRSFERVDGAACMVASPILHALKKAQAEKLYGLPSVAGYAFTADLCAEVGDLYVLCEKSCEPVETITGSYEGTITTTTTTSGFTVVDTIYTATVTTTVTLVE